jgi:hypothetical protein
MAEPASPPKPTRRRRKPATAEKPPDETRQTIPLPTNFGAEPQGALGPIFYPGVPLGSDDRPATPPRGFARGGGRVSWDSFFQFWGGFQYLLPPDETIEAWRSVSLDAANIQRIPAQRLLRILADVAPDVSRALWDFLRLCNPGWTCTAYKPGTNQPHARGQQVLDDWTNSLKRLYGSVDVPIGRIHFGAFLRGALMAELVFDADGRTPVDLATPDPVTAIFRRSIDPVRGQIWQLGQLQLTRWVLLDRPSITYIPVDPAPGDPYGRSPSAPAIFTSLFLLGLLNDLRRVVAMQGYQRYDLVVKLEQLRQMAIPQILSDPNAWKEFVDNTVNAVSTAYNMLEPDSAWVHTDLVEVSNVTGALNAESMNGVGQLIEALERLLARALKSMPLLMGMLEGSSEANANRQWELQAAGVKSVQHLSESMLGDFGTLILEAAGINATCEWQFAELRAAELYRDEMTKALATDNATKGYLMGWESQESASLAATGHPPDLPEPRAVPATEVPPMFGTATAGGQVPQRPGGSDNQSGEFSEPGSQKEAAQDAGRDAERGRSTRRGGDFSRLRWPKLVVNDVNLVSVESNGSAGGDDGLERIG